MSELNSILNLLRNLLLQFGYRAEFPFPSLYELQQKF